MRLTATRNASSGASAGLGEGRVRLLAQVVLELLPRRTPVIAWRLRLRPPLRDLLLERSICDSHAGHAFVQIPRQGTVDDLPLLPLGRELRAALYVIR